MIAVLGAFDGFHRGHQSLFVQAKQRADREQTAWGVVTFSPHPQMVMSSGIFFNLFTEHERQILAQYFEIPRWEIIPFTHGLADMSPERFLDILATRYALRGIVVGRNFFFGRGRSGDIAFLQQECLRRGWTCDVVSPLLQDGHTVSSTAIRRLLLEGNVMMARSLLGYPFGMLATVVHGDHRGQSLGFPTANLSCPSGKLLPPGGVYAVAVVAEGRVYPGAANMGYNPTFAGQRSLRFEVFLLNFSGNLYEKTLGTFFLEHLREERRFLSVAELVAQLQRDRDGAGEIFCKHMADENLARFLQHMASVGVAPQSFPLSPGGNLC